VERKGDTITLIDMLDVDDTTVAVTRSMSTTS
jgi:hypothetical protein